MCATTASWLYVSAAAADYAAKGRLEVFSLRLLDFENLSHFIFKLKFDHVAGGPTDAGAKLAKIFDGLIFIYITWVHYYFS